MYSKPEDAEIFCLQSVLYICAMSRCILQHLWVEVVLWLVWVFIFLVGWLVFFYQFTVEKWAKVWMKRISESCLLSLDCYRVSTKVVNQLPKRILVGHKLNDACRYFVGKLYFIIFLTTLTFCKLSQRNRQLPFWFNWSIAQRAPLENLSLICLPLFHSVPCFCSASSSKIGYRQSFSTLSYVLPYKNLKCMELFLQWVFC